MQKRPIFKILIKKLQEPRRFIQVLLGPRQVGKTTLALQVTQTLDKPFHFISADLATLQDLAWLQQQWEVARQKIVAGKGCLLIIDEVQKIPNRSSLIKTLWDADSRNSEIQQLWHIIWNYLLEQDCFRACRNLPIKKSGNEAPVLNFLCTTQRL